MGRKTTRKEYTCLYTIAGEEGPYRRLTVKASSVADALAHADSLVCKGCTYRTKDGHCNNANPDCERRIEQFMAFETRTTKTKGQ